MDQPTAVLITRNDSVVHLQSNSGVFNKQTDIVSMSGAVVVTQPDRNLRLDTEALEANLKAGDMHSDVAVQVQDIDRRINADSMQVYDNGARIVFGGAAKMIIENSNAIAPVPKAVVRPKTNKAKI
jgi:LPS export ABC transporter protein LptC